MRKEKDVQKLEKIAKLLKEALISIYDIENQNEIFNSKQALALLDKYSSLNISLDDLVYNLSAYFEELALLDEK